MRFRPAPALTAAAVVLLAGCGSGPSGPGVLKGTVRATAPETVGAVVLEVTGSGIRGFESENGTVVYGAVLDQTTGRWRMVAAGTGPLSFGVKVDDVKGPRPQIQVISAADDENTAIPASDVKVSLSK